MVLAVPYRVGGCWVLLGYGSIGSMFAASGATTMRVMGARDQDSQLWEFPKIRGPEYRPKVVALVL